MTGELPLEVQIERHLEANPDASVAELAGAIGAPPEAIHEIVDGDTTASAENTNTRTPDRVRRSRTRPGPDLQPRFSTWSDADFANPDAGVWPRELLEREQWMGHVEKKPFAPWADRDHPDADPDDDARWKWGLAENWADGETIAMAEIDPRLDGRAFLQTEDDPYVYVDGDDVRCPETGEVHPAFVAILELLGPTYADVSQSGAGVHAIYQGDLEDLDLKQASWRLDEDPWGANEDLPSIEIYPGKRVCVMTGEHVPGTPTEVREWNDDVLEPICEATEQFGQGGRDRDQGDDVSVDREDYDLEDYEPQATASSETTDDIRDVFAAIDRLDAQRVAGRTIVQRWNDSASTSEGERAFWPTWGSLNDGGTANIVNSERWQDTGELGGYGGVVTMAAIDAGEIRPANARPVKGETWWRGVEHLRELGFPIPKYEPDPDPAPAPAITGAGETRYDVEECEPPTRETEAFDRDQRWDELQGDRFEKVLEDDHLHLWGDEAGAGKTTNAALAALQRDTAHTVYFDKHQKAREFVTDDVIQDFEFDVFTDPEYYHLRGGEQKRMGHCMDADHADESCPEHGDTRECPSMCPVFDLEKEHPVRESYEALVPEVGPNKAHQILELHDQDENPWHGGECAWQAQYSDLEGEPFIAGVHPYMTQKSARDTTINIIDETPSLESFERTLSVTDLTRIANTLESIADHREKDPENYRELARFSRDVVDAITDVDGADSIAELEPPSLDWVEYYKSVGQEGNKYVHKVLPAETLAEIKVNVGETVLDRMHDGRWEGTPLSIDPLLAAAVEAGFQEDIAMQAIAVPPILEHCPWCRSDVEFDNGAHCCSSDDCDWHEFEHTITRRDGELARATVWLETDRAGSPTLKYRELPLPSTLPDPSSTIVLDATSNPEKVATLFGIDLEDVVVSGDQPLDIPGLEVTQVLDGQYHAGTIEQAINEERTLAKRIQRTIDTVGTVHKKPLFVVKSTLIPEFEWPDNAEVLHYHATRGLNRNDCDAVVCIGAPHPDVDDLERDAELLAMGRNDVNAGGVEHSTRAGAECPPVYRKLHYEDDDGRGRAVPTKHYTGLVGSLFRESRESELVQAIHRVRPLLADADDPKHAYLLTNVPTSVTIDEVATFEELADPLEALLPVPEGAIDLLRHTEAVLDGDGPDGFRPESLVDVDDDGSIAMNKRAFHRLASVCGMNVSYATVSRYVNALEDVGLLEGEKYEQHAGVTYASDLATFTSALQVLSNSASLKVAAARRFRSIIEESGETADWLAWAREVFDLEFGPPSRGSPSDGGG